MTEREIQHQVRLAMQGPDVLLWRNNAGVGLVGHGAQARKTRFGLVVGASDLIGILTIRAGDLPPDQLIGRFAALELKSDTGRLTPEQSLFLQLVRNRGGCASVARSVSDATEILTRWRSGAVE